MNNSFGRIDNRPSIFGSGNAFSGSTDFGSSLSVAQSIFKSSSFVSSGHTISGVSGVTFDKFDNLDQLGSDRDDLESSEDEDDKDSLIDDIDNERTSHAVPTQSEKMPILI